jgi:hypothetical protein
VLNARPNRYSSPSSRSCHLFLDYYAHPDKPNRIEDYYKTNRIFRLGGCTSFRCASQADLVSLLRRWKTRQSKSTALMNAQLLSSKANPKPSGNPSVSVERMGRLGQRERPGDSREVDSKVLYQVRFRSKEQVLRRVHIVPYGEREACHERSLGSETKFSPSGFQGISNWERSRGAHRSCKTGPYPQYPRTPPRH